ncbi:MAG: F0F1 ATP synthase subunit B [Lautropia sp.]|nr:F0F1 ATP synthase subunit B [Lautropia sp.]
MYINATIIVQVFIFAALWWFVAKFVWPPITAALDERSKKIAAGLAAADQAKADLQLAGQRAEQEMQQARANAIEVRAGADKQAAELIEQARAEAARIISSAQKSAAEEAALAAERARDQLRDQVAKLAVSGAERILKREINAERHADLLSNLKNELR